MVRNNMSNLVPQNSRQPIFVLTDGEHSREDEHLATANQSALLPPHYLDNPSIALPRKHERIRLVRVVDDMNLPFGILNRRGGD